MKLSPGEKLILVALADATKPKEQRELDFAFVRDAILDGHLWALDWEMSYLSEENETSADVARETADILTMWRLIETSFERLPEQDREKVQEAAGPYSLKFDGFDGNHDPHYSVAKFLVDNMGRFSELKGRYMNSHTQSSLPKYQKMLPKFNAAMDAKSIVSDFLLTADEIISIVRPNTAISG